MDSIWSTQHTYELWLRVEIAVAEAWHDVGEVPETALESIRAATFNEADIARHETEVQHDLIAFLRSMNDGLGDAGRFVHLGLTSNDVKDTALSLQLLESCDLIIEGLETLRFTIRRLALDHRSSLMMGRTHGVHAEPITFGFKLAVWYMDLERCLAKLRDLRSQLGVAKIAGAVGTHSNVPPHVEESAAQILGLNPSAAETQVIQRDRHARYVLELAVLGSVLDKFATELRTLQRTEIREVQEPFGERQAGSSAMPHKRNPNLSERISGLARVLRGYAPPMLENIVLWDERDISNSSVERVVLPDASALADYMLHLMNHIFSGLVVFPERMRRNIEVTKGLVFSQRVLRALLDAGMSRSDAYAVVQENSLTAFDTETPLVTLLEADTRVRSLLSKDKLQDLFDYGWFTQNIDVTFERAGLSEQKQSSQATG